MKSFMTSGPGYMTYLNLCIKHLNVPALSLFARASAPVKSNLLPVFSSIMWEN